MWALSGALIAAGRTGSQLGRTEECMWSAVEQTGEWWRGGCGTGKECQGMKLPGGRRRWSSPRGAPDVACSGGIGGKGTPSWHSVTAFGECRKAWILILVYVPVNYGFLVVVIDCVCGFSVDW